MTGKTSSREIWKRLGRVIKPDWLFGFLLIASGFILIGENFDPEPVIPVDPTLKILILAGLTLVAGFLTTFLAALDKRHADDYFFQLVSSGAIIGIVTAMFVHIIWDFIYGPLGGDDLVAIMMAGWSLGYFFYRFRGLNA